jgi:hypothetical protein
MSKEVDTVPRVSARKNRHATRGKFLGSCMWTQSQALDMRTYELLQGSFSSVHKQPVNPGSWGKADPPGTPYSERAYNILIGIVSIASPGWRILYHIGSRRIFVDANYVVGWSRLIRIHPIENTTLYGALRIFFGFRLNVTWLLGG